MSRPISVRDLTMQYSDTLALDNVSFSMEKGEMLAILGPSGCGKSTLLSLIAGLRHATRGEIYLGDQRIDGLPPQKRGTGFLFQNYALFPHLTVRDNIGFGLKIRRVPKLQTRKRVDELLDLIGLREHQDKYPRQLSGGQQQRVALARALAPSPDVLLLDEPLSALDVKIRQRLRQELKALQREVGITTIIVTHDQEEAFELGDRVGVMNEGKLEQLAPPDEIYDRPRTEFVACFVGQVNILSGVAFGGKAYSCSLEVPLPDSLNALPNESPVRILIRPENFSLEKEHPDAVSKGAVRGTIRSTVFLGSVIRLEVRLDNGQVITAVMPKEQVHREGFNSGVRVIVRARANQIVPADGKLRTCYTAV